MHQAAEKRLLHCAVELQQIYATTSQTVTVSSDSVGDYEFSRRIWWGCCRALPYYTPISCVRRWLMWCLQFGKLLQSWENSCCIIDFHSHWLSVFHCLCGVGSPMLSFHAALPPQLCLARWNTSTMASIQKGIDSSETTNSNHCCFLFVEIVCIRSWNGGTVLTLTVCLSCVTCHLCHNVFWQEYVSISWLQNGCPK